MQSLSFRYARLIALVGILLAGSSAIHVTHAAMADEIRLAKDMVEGAMLDLDDARTAQARTALLQDALEGLGILDRMADAPAQNPAAHQALEDLGRQAITMDVLRLSLIEALCAEMSKSSDGLQKDLDAKALAEGVDDPGYRSAAWSLLARVHLQAGHGQEAERLAARAISDARAIEREATRNGALRAAILVFPATEPLDGLVDVATDAMTTAAARSEILRLRALAALTPRGKLSSDAIWEIGRQAVSRQVYDEAIQAGRALDRDDDRRGDILEDVLKSALASGNEALGMQAAKSMARDRDQDRALRRIVDARIERGRPLRAATILPLMLTGNARTEAQIEIAGALADQGYHKTAQDMLTSLDPSPVDDPDSAAELAVALADTALHEKALILADRILDGKERSFAYARISRKLAEDGRLREAEALFANVTLEDDMALAKTALAKALLKAGQRGQAKDILEVLPDGKSRDSLLEEFVRDSADKRRPEEARSFLARIGAAEARSRALVTIALVFHGQQDHVASRAALKEAHELLTGERTAKALADVAIAYARIGDVRQADLVLGGMPEGKLRDSTSRRIAEILVRKGDLQGARSRLTALTEAGRNAVSAELALAQFQQDGKVEALISAITDLPPGPRVATLRKMSENRVRLLDRAGWLGNPFIDPLALGHRGDGGQRADFLVGQHVIHAPAPATRSAGGMVMPDIFSIGATHMRARVPAPARGRANIALLGFSPFSPAAVDLADAMGSMATQIRPPAQTAWPYYIAVTDGVVTLGDILRDLPEARARNFLIDKGDVLEVRVPIIILPAATLVVSGAEFLQYRLGLYSGAFLAVAGKLVVQDADIVGYDELADAPARAADGDNRRFRPFITGWGGSDFQIAGSRLAMLGYDSAKTYGLTQSVGTADPSVFALDDNRPSGDVIDNSFENLRYGYHSSGAADVRLIGNEYRDSIVHGIGLSDQSQHLLVALNTAHGSQGRHGIVMSRDNGDSFLVGNVSLGNKGSGLMLDRTSRHNVIYANTSLGNGADGLTLYESSCNIAIANEFSGNRRTGIKVRNSMDVGLYDNRIHNNLANGAYVYASALRQSNPVQRPLRSNRHRSAASAVISGNNFAANGNAINVDGATETILDANSFRDQRNYIYGGDLRPLSPYLLQLGEKAPVLVGIACQPQRPRDECRFGEVLREARSDVICTGMSPTRPAGTNGKIENNG